MTQEKNTSFSSDKKKPSITHGLLNGSDEPASGVSNEVSKYSPQILELPDVNNEVYESLASQAKEYINGLLSVNIQSPAFTAKIKKIESLGNATMLRLGDGSRRILNRSLRENVNDMNSHEYVSNSLSNLSKLVEELSPSDENLNPKFLGIFPRKVSLNNYFAKYENAETSLNTVIKSLLRGREELMKDNASLEQEKRDLESVLTQLNEFAVLVDILESETLKEIKLLKNNKKTKEALILENEILFAVRQKKQDILTRINVGLHSYMAMDLIRRNNTELSKGIDRARITTMTALRTAILISQSLTNQKILLDQVDSIMRSTESASQKANIAFSRESKNLSKETATRDSSIHELQQAFSEISTALSSIKDIKVSAQEELDTAKQIIEETMQEGAEKLINVIKTDDSFQAADKPYTGADHPDLRKSNLKDKNGRYR